MSKKQSESKLSNLIKQVDCFGDEVTFQINKTRRFQTIPGGICSLIAIFVVIAYAVRQTQLMIIFQNTSIWKIRVQNFVTMFDSQKN